jgi:hypothetical protein
VASLRGPDASSDMALETMPLFTGQS